MNDGPYTLSFQQAADILGTIQNNFEACRLLKDVLLRAASAEQAVREQTIALEEIQAKIAAAHAEARQAEEGHTATALAQREEIERGYAALEEMRTTAAAEAARLEGHIAALTTKRDQLVALIVDLKHKAAAV